jgi:hypothetical protein
LKVAAELLCPGFPRLVLPVLSHLVYEKSAPIRAGSFLRQFRPLVVFAKSPATAGKTARGPLQANKSAGRIHGRENRWKLPQIRHQNRPSHASFAPQNIRASNFLFLRDQSVVAAMTAAHGPMHKFKRVACNYLRRPCVLC